MYKRTFAALAAAVVLPLAVQAAAFPDVPNTHPFSVQINELADAGVVTGNPDGTFRPSDPVNRAAMLKLSYLVRKRDAANAKRCFPDIPEGSWYEAFVCDAVLQKYVKGYGDGTFKPARPVSRAEGLKIALVVLGIPLPGESGVRSHALQYTDVPPDAWFAPYVAAALERGILPLPGMETAGPFNGNAPLERAEAAAYIWNAMHASLNSSAASTSSSSMPTASSSSATSMSASSATNGPASSSRSSRSSLDDTGASARVLSMIFPITDTQRFQAKTPFSYRFSLSKPGVLDITASLREAQKGEINCTLFRLLNQGMSTEYYLGYVEGQSCFLHVAAVAGDYQLQLQPTFPDTEYLVESSFGTGDGNDGFSQAQPLAVGQQRADELGAGDLEDWYAFSVRQQRTMTLSLTSTDHLRCLIYPAGDVDLFGFEMPSCGKAFEFPIGTYYVGVGRAFPKAAKQSYGLQLR